MATIFIKNGFKKVVIVFLAIACGLLTFLYPQWQEFAQAQGYFDFDFDVVQVVFKPDIGKDTRTDLVLDKETAIIVTTTASSIGTAFVEATLDGQVVVSNNVQFNFNSVSGVYEGIAYFTPATSGTQPLEVLLNGVLIDTMDVDVKGTRGLNIGYYRADDCLIPSLVLDLFVNCYGSVSLQDFNETIQKSNEFIEATYPIATFTGTAHGLLTFPGNPIPVVGLAEDILLVSLWGRLEGHDKALLVVPRDYFDYHGSPITNPTWGGVSFPNSWGGMFIEGFWTAAAHEIGHMYGIGEEDGYEEEYDAFDPLPGAAAEGFWVSEKTHVNKSFCFMGNSVQNAFNRWVDNDHYEYLFNEFLVNPVDPETLIVTAMLHSDGTVDFRSWYFEPNGEITESSQGEYALRVVDAGGQTLAETTFSVDFKMFLEPFGVQPVDTVPLIMAVPYPEEAAVVQIVRNGVPFAEVSVTTKLLHDAIDAIPDFGFNKNPSQRRKALHNKVGAIENMIEAGNTMGAQQKLVKDLAPSIERWLVDDYVKIEPTQLEKAEVLTVIEAVGKRIENL